MTRVFVIDLATVLVFSLLAYEIASRIVRPLDVLSDGARRISGGELDVELPDTGSQDELALLTHAFNDMTRQIRQSRAELERQHHQVREQSEELRRANETLEKLSNTDGLTALSNRRYFQLSLEREVESATRSGDPLALLLVDIDDFKALNDRYGHAEGDAVLAGVARVLGASVRASDILARYGGEEFVVLAPRTDARSALLLGEVARSAIAGTGFMLHGSSESVHVTVSVGIAVFAGDPITFFRAADHALYRAKAAGKDRVIAADASDPAA